MFNIKINDEKKSFDKKIKILDLTNGDKNIICAKVNNHIRELNYEVYYDADIELCDKNNDASKGTYRRSLIFIFLNAAHIICPEIRFKISFSVSRCLFVRDVSGKPINMEIVEQIENKMKELVKQDLLFEKEIATKDEAIKYYEKLNQQDKIDILKYRPEKSVHFYNCNGYKNYLFGHMVPSTGYITDFRLKNYYPGILISYLNYDENPFKEEPNFAKSMAEESNWNKKTNTSLVSHINDMIPDEKARDLINLCEIRHYGMLTHLGDTIEKQIKESRLICIAGPSSSGKTTFANRLADELRSRGLKPLRISLDDYYLPKDQIPLDENGETDFEHIDALDKKLFNQNMLDLLNGKEVSLPQLDFKTKKRSYKEHVSVTQEQPIIIEGIHALNEEMSSMIPKANKFKIFIAPQVQINLDYDNPISMTDLRLLRRIVRDNEYRGTSVDKTIAMWPSVRRGEFKWIYKTQEEADYVFDSFLAYEPCVLKKYALPLLKQVSQDKEEFHIADRLIRFLKYFKEIDPEFIPCNSLVREFIGGSSYE